MVHKHHTFTLILGAVFGVVLSLAIAFLTFFGLTQLPFFADNSETDEKTEAFLSSLVDSIRSDATREETAEVPVGIALDSEIQPVVISEIRGTVQEADVRGFTMETLLPGAEEQTEIRVNYAAATLLSSVSSRIPTPGQAKTAESVIGPTQIEPDDAVIVYTTAEITTKTATLVARQVKQIQ